MELVELTEYLVKMLVKDKEAVEVKLSETDEKIIEVLVPEAEIGAVIGHGGKIANSIRNIVQASAYINELGYVKININAK